MIADKWQRFLLARSHSHHQHQRTKGKHL